MPRSLFLLRSASRRVATVRCLPARSSRFSTQAAPATGNDPPLHDTTNTASQNSNDNSYSTSHNTRNALLASALTHVPEYGWTTEAILAAVRHQHPQASLSYATTLTATDLVHYFMQDCNDRLRSLLREEQTESHKQQQTSRTDRLHHALRTRLNMVVEYVAVGRWHEGMALGATHPQTAWETSEHLKEMIEIVVQYEQEAASLSQEAPQLGNDSTTGSTENTSEWAQFTLGAVYVATECHLLSDTSDGYQQTWHFLRQQLQQWEVLHHHQQHGQTQFPTHLGPVSLNDAAFLASTVATAIGNGIISVSSVSPPSKNSILPSLDQISQSLYNAAISSSQSTAKTSPTKPPSS